MGATGRQFQRPSPITVRQLGPRKLWDEAEAAYDWWYEQGEPGLDGFGFEIREGQQWVWLEIARS